MESARKQPSTHREEGVAHSYQTQPKPSFDEVDDKKLIPTETRGNVCQDTTKNKTKHNILIIDKENLGNPSKTKLRFFLCVFYHMK